jgi:hypothetical protein
MGVILLLVGKEVGEIIVSPQEEIRVQGKGIFLCALGEEVSTQHPPPE